MTDLVIHPTLQRQLQAYIDHPSHAILLHGKKSSGKKALAAYMAAQIKASKPHSKVLYIRPLDDKKTISIDQIKQLKLALRSKDESYRIIVIPDAHQLTTEAQNSFLKLLEEPPENVIFILTTHNEYTLLATIRSRLLKVSYLTPTEDQLQAYIRQYGTDIPEKNITISEGRMGLLSALVAGETAHPLIHDIEVAKDILSEIPVDRLVRVETMSKDDENVANILDALLLVCNAALTNSVDNQRQYHRWLQCTNAIEAASNQLALHISAKLVLTRLFLVV